MDAPTAALPKTNRKTVSFSACRRITPEQHPPTITLDPSSTLEAQIGLIGNIDQTASGRPRKLNEIGWHTTQGVPASNQELPD